MINTRFSSEEEKSRSFSVLSGYYPFFEKEITYFLILFFVTPYFPKFEDDFFVSSWRKRLFL